MTDNQPKEVMIMLTTDLAERSLTAANAMGLSRSALVRWLLANYLEQNGATT